MLGRQWHRERGKLDTIRPGETRIFSIEIGVAEGAKLDVMLSKLGHAPGAADVAKL